MTEFFAIALFAALAWALFTLHRANALHERQLQELQRLGDQHLVYLDREARKISTLLSAILNELRRER